MTVRELIRRYSDDTGIPYDIAKTTILATYKHMRDKQEEMSELHLNMYGIGQWNMKTWKLDKLRDKVQKQFDNNPTSGKLDMLRKTEQAIELRKNEKTRKNQHWVYRKQWEKEERERKLVDQMNQAEQDKPIKDNTNEQTTGNKGETAEGMGEQGPDS